MHRKLYPLVLALLCVPAVTDAQTTVQRPSRPYRGLFGGGPPLDPNRTRQELTFNASVLAGYEDRVTPGGLGSVAPGQPTESGYIGTADVGLNYFIGRAARSLAIDVRGFSSAYSFLDSNPGGGDATILAETLLDSRTRVNVRQSAGYAPNLVLGAFDSIQPNVEGAALPDSGQRSGLAEQRSWSTHSTVGLDRQWTARQSTTAGYVYSQRHYLDEFGFDGSWHMANGRYSWAFNRRSVLQVGYRYSHSEFTDPSAGATQPSIPLTDHEVELGGSYTKRISPTRQLMIFARGGASYVETVRSSGEPIDYWMPSAIAALRMDVGRSWGVAADYRRGVSVLQGVTLESFATDTASLRANGLLGSRLEAILSGAYSNGRAAAAGETSRFVNLGGSAELRYAFGRFCAATVAYDYEYYQLRDIQHRITGFPNRYDRNAVRVGLDFWLPFYGSYVDRGRRRPAGGSGS